MHPNCMSAFLYFSRPLIPGGSAPALALAALREALTHSGWNFLEKTDSRLTVMPPQAEAYGNKIGAEFITVHADTDALHFQQGILLAQEQASMGLQPQTQVLLPKTIRSLPIDLLTGCSLAISVHARTFLIASETQTAWHGPYFAAWAEQEGALSACPRDCVPIQLLTGDLGQEPTGPAFTSEGASMSFGQGYGLVSSKATTTALALTPSTAPADHLETPVNLCVTDTYHYAMRAGSAADPLIGWLPRAVRHTTSFTGGSLTTSLLTAELVEIDGSLIACAYAPGLSFSDVIITAGTPPSNGRSTLISNPLEDVALSAPVSDNDSVIYVEDGSVLGESGILMLPTEAVHFARKDRNMLLGLTRAVIGTPAISVPAGTHVREGITYLRVNNAMLRQEWGQ